MPAPVRLDAETALYQRWLGGLLFVYQRDADPETGAFPLSNQPVAPTGSTAIYSDPLGYGLRQSGHAAASPVAVTDGDVASAVGNWDMFLDLSEYRLINNILGSFTDVTESDFGRSASYNQLSDRIAKRASEILSIYKQFINPFRPGASSGAVRTVFPTSSVPPWGPGYNGRNRGGYGGGRFGGFGGW